MMNAIVTCSLPAIMKSSLVNFIAFIVITSWLVAISCETNGQASYRFEHITKKDGLSQGTINVIFEDSYGLMWFGTKDGLNLYDGNEIKVFRRNFQDDYSLPNNHILSIEQDNNGRLWIGTSGNNLCYYNPVTDQFYPWQHPIIFMPSASKKGIKYFMPEATRAFYNWIWSTSPMILYR